VYLYSALFGVPHTRATQAWITVLPAITPMPAFTSFIRWRLPRL